MKIRVYYEDTDCGNVVYYANYLKYMERSRTEYMRERGIELEEYHRKGYIFAVTEAHIKYRLPARYNDVLAVTSTLTDATSVAIAFKTDIHNDQGDLLVTGTVKLVCISAEQGKACKAPPELIAALE